MDSNQKEILERLLLMMKYDSSKTLNENKKEIRLISEQYSPSNGGFNGDKTGWKPYSYSDSKGKYMSNVEGWSQGIDFPYVGQWLPNSDSRVTNPNIRFNFKIPKDGKGAFFIPLTYEQPIDGYYSKGLFHDWDGKVLKDANGFYYINMYEKKADSNSFSGLKKTGNYFRSYLIKNGKGLKYNPFTMFNGAIDPRVSTVKLSDTLLDKSGKLKDTKNLKSLLDSIDKPETGIMDTWLKNPINSEFGKLINAWVDLIMSKNLDELLKLYNDVVKLGKGGNTRDLPNYGKGTTTFSSMVLENEIYNRRAQNRQQGQPEPPKPEVIDGKTMYGIPQGYFVKTATDLYNQTYEDTPNKDNVDTFRTWFNYFFPDKSKNPCGDGENLDKTGPVNKYVICAANFIPKKIERKGLLINPLGGTIRPPSIENTNTKTAFNIFKENPNSKLSTEPKPEPKRLMGLTSRDIVMMAREAGVFVDDTLGNDSFNPEGVMNQLQLKDPEKYKFTTSDYESVKKSLESEMEARKENIKMANPEYKKQKENEKEEKEKSQKEEFYKFVITQTRVTNIYDTTWLECTIGVKNESECGKTPYCGRGGKEFLEKIARGELKTSDGKTVGSPYIDNSGNVKYYVPDVTSDGDPLKNQWDVPCTSDTWDEYGGYIQIGGAIAALIASSIVTGPLGAGITAGIITELTVDAIIGGYALYQSIKEKDNIGIAVNAIFLALPLILDIPATDKFFKQIKYGREAISNLSSKFDTFKLSNPNYTSQELETWLNGLSGYELNTFNKVIKQMETDTYFQSQMKDAIKRNSDLFADATISAKRFWIPKPGIQKMLVYTGPMAGYLFATKNKAIKDNLIRLESNKRLTVSQVVAWDAALMNCTNDELVMIQKAVAANNNYFYEMSKLPEYQDAYKIKKELENFSMNEADAQRLLDSFNAAVDDLLDKALKPENLKLDSVKTNTPTDSIKPNISGAPVKN